MARLKLGGSKAPRAAGSIVPGPYVAITITIMPPAHAYSVWRSPRPLTDTLLHPQRRRYLTVARVGATL